MNNQISEAQKFLNVPQTGILDELTRAALRNYQQKNGLVASGVLDTETTNRMFVNGGDLDTDLSKRPIIKSKFLPKDEYLGPSKKRYIFLHYTAGWENPYNVINGWDADTRGPIATQYVIGGINPVTADPKYDGEIVQCMPNSGFGWHLGIGNTAVHRESVGIEICNFGWVTLGGWRNLRTNRWITGKPDAFYTYTGAEIRREFVEDLGREFRGFRYYHKFTDKQIDALEFLIPEIAKHHKIDIREGLQTRLKNLPTNSKFNAFEFDERIRSGTASPTGVYSHTNVVSNGKWDVSPQKNLIEMLLNLEEQH